MSVEVNIYMVSRHDFRGKCETIKGKIPTYFITGEYDFACTPEMTRDTAAKVKNSATAWGNRGCCCNCRSPLAGAIMPWAQESDWKRGAAAYALRTMSQFRFQGISDALSAASA